MRVATKPALTSGLFNPPLWTPDLLAWKCPKEPEGKNNKSASQIFTKRGVWTSLWRPTPTYLEGVNHSALLSKSNINPRSMRSTIFCCQFMQMHSRTNNLHSCSMSLMLIQEIAMKITCSMNNNKTARIQVSVLKIVSITRNSWFSRSLAPIHP
jgi:hypothetical protein